MVETTKEHYFLVGNAIYAVQVVRRDSGTVASYCRIPNTKRLVKECSNKDEATSALFNLVNEGQVRVCSL
ncbi:MAG: hypothetical protein HQL06_11415 [Nitrospirae bacterium]|nr:hypothetical protein [Nitrospirota bacterium]